MSIENISEATKKTIVGKSVSSLPTRPSEEGITAQEIKRAMFGFVTDNNGSVLSEINRIVGQINQYIEDVAANIEAAGSAVQPEALEDYCTLTKLAQSLSDYRTAAEQDAIDAEKPKKVTVTLTTTGWDNYRKTVSVTGVTAGNTVFVAADPASLGEYREDEIYCVEQGNGTLTFQCTFVPAVNVTVNVVIFN